MNEKDSISKYLIGHDVPLPECSWSWGSLVCFLITH
jgi:hypothetical protein